MFAIDYFFNRKNDELSPAKNLARLTEKVNRASETFTKRIEEIEKFAQEHKKQIKRLKNFCHSIDNILISDKSSDLKLIFANEPRCIQLYGLPHVCSELILGRYEYEVINDYIERSGKWNSFAECQSFNIDDIVIDEQIQKEFLQIGFIAGQKIILKTTIKPYFENDNFDGVMTISKIISEEYFKKLFPKYKSIYNNNLYEVYQEIEK